MPLCTAAGQGQGICCRHGGMALLLPLLALVAALLLGQATPAWAHSGGLGAFLTLEPAHPVPGETTRLVLEVVDAYNNPVSGLNARIALAGGGGRRAGSPVALTEEAPGRYRGELRFAAAGEWRVEMEVEAAGWRYLGQVPVTVGAGGEPVADLGLVLEPVEDGLGHDSGPWLTAAGALAALGLAGLTLWWLRRRR